MTEFFPRSRERPPRPCRPAVDQIPVFVVCLGFSLAGTGGRRLYGHYRDEAAQAASAESEAAAQLSRDGKSAEATAAFDALSKTAPKGYAIIARLRPRTSARPAISRRRSRPMEGLAADRSFDPVF